MGHDADITGMTDAGLVVAISRYQQQALAEAYRRHAGAVFGWPAACSPARRPRPRRSSRRCSCGCGSTPRSSTRAEARSAPTCWPTATAAPSTCCGPTRPAASEERDLQRTAEAGYDVEREVWDLAVSRAGRLGPGGAARGRAPGHRASPTTAATATGEVASLLGPARRYGQEPDPQRAQAVEGRAGHRRAHRRRSGR